MEHIDWKKYVDAIYGIHFLPYKSRRVSFEVELDYMDILHNPIFKYHFTYPNVFDRPIVDYYHPTFRDYNNERKSLVTNITLAYHSIFREAQELGYRSICIVEDDIRFLHDKQSWIQTLEHLPTEWDFIQFDKILNRENNHRLQTLQKGEWFHSNYTGGYWGSAFCFWSEAAINLAVELQEHEFIVSDYLLINRDDPRLDSFKRFVPAKHLMWQASQPEHYIELTY